MAAHSSVLAWRIPWTEEPGGLQPMESQRDRHHWSDLARIIKGMEKAMAPHSSTLAWKIPWMAEPGRLQYMGSLRVGHDWVISLSLFPFTHWRRKWRPTPVFWRIPGMGEPGGLPSMGSHRVIHDSVRPHRRQPTRLLRPWDFPSKSTGVGCHCKLLLMKQHEFYNRMLSKGSLI